jgi:tripartite-type tricarboxylate transporter receptor subunit TctC
MVVAPALYPKLDYDPIASFTPIGMAVRGPLILGEPPRPAQHGTSRALLDLARRQPLTVASAGTGSVGHLTAELFDRSADVDILHIPYRGGAPALSDVLGGQVDLLFDTVTLLYPQIAAQKLRAYAVTGAQRYSATARRAHGVGSVGQALRSLFLVRPDGPPPTRRSR